MSGDWDDLWPDDPEPEIEVGAPEPPAQLPGQVALFGDDDQFRTAYQLWGEMPEYEQENQLPDSSVVVNFQNGDDRRAFETLVGQKIGPKSKSIWYPEPELRRFMDKRWRATEGVPDGAPIYVVSKGRADAPDRVRTTAYLERYQVPFRVVVERQEQSAYAARVGADRVIVLDPDYQRDYDAFDDLGLSKSKGPGPARNFAWDHAISIGAKWHWVMDDNIMGFYRLQKNLKVPVADAMIFRLMERHAARFDNVLMVGPQYFMFAPTRAPIPPLVLNTRIYSCNLIRNDAPYRWRGRYNEDTDISLRMLKDGFVTIQYNAFVQDKLTTQHLRGGNTAEFYAIEGTRPKSEMLQRMHPDVSRVVERFGRIHHYVDYDRFTQLPSPFPRWTDRRLEYGMVLERRHPETGEWERFER